MGWQLSIEAQKQAEEYERDFEKSGAERTSSKLGIF
jgi:hypothetical protein